jgi:hypothetical protein
MYCYSIDYFQHSIDNGLRKLHEGAPHLSGPQKQAWVAGHHSSSDSLMDCKGHTRTKELTVKGWRRIRIDGIQGCNSFRFHEMWQRWHRIHGNLDDIQKGVGIIPACTKVPMVRKPPDLRS